MKKDSIQTRKRKPKNLKVMDPQAASQTAAGAIAANNNNNSSTNNNNNNNNNHLKLEPGNIFFFSINFSYFW